MKRILLLALLFSFFTSCSTMHKGIVTFSEASPEIFSKSSLEKFLASNANPKIMVRVPYSAKDATTEEPFSRSGVYNAIEKELLRSGFDVRDRGLFNEVLKNMTSTDYSKIKNLTDTDLILELVDLRIDVEYTTNKYVTPKRKKEKTLPTGNITLYGASAEFKIILVSTNEVAGSYEFNYAPCTRGCGYYINAKGNIFKSDGSKISKVESYELVETSFLIDFMTVSTSELIENLK